MLSGSWPKVANVICPVCKDMNYMRWAPEKILDMYDMKCLKCGFWFASDDFIARPYKGKHEKKEGTDV